LPDHLRVFITKLGIVGDHRDTPARTIVTEPTSGQEFVLDHTGDVNVPAPIKAETIVDANGQETTHYEFLGQDAERAFIEKTREEVRKSGKKVEITKRTVTPFLLGGPLRIKFSIGGREGLRAAARIALNFLAVHAPSEARAPGLEPFKKWILGSAENDFAWFGVPLPEGSVPPLSVEHGHRVLLAFDHHRVFARVVFFDAYEVAMHLGNVEADMGVSVVGFDIDPLAKALKRSPDLRQLPAESLTAQPEDVGRRISANEAEVNAVFERAGGRLSAIVEKSQSEEGDRRLTLILEVLRPTAELEGEARLAALAELVEEHCPQHATNRVLEALRLVGNLLEHNGAPEAYVVTVRQFARPGTTSASIQFPVDGFVRLMLRELLAELFAAPDIEKSKLGALLDGEPGLRLALNVVIAGIRLVPGFAQYMTPPAASDASGKSHR
jgi:hypothetical protein